MLELKQAALTYAKTLIFENLSFTVKPGNWLVIMGPSGVGKTSLLRLIAGLNQARPEQETEIKGQVIWQDQAQYKVAYMAQQDGLFPWLSVLDNLLLPFHLSGKKPSQTEAENLLKAVKLQTYQKAMPKALSGGMRQRVALARTLIQHTDLVLMDEPFSALDAMTRMDMQALSFKLLREAKKTVVLVTHDPWEALRLADTILVLGGQPAQIQAQINLPQAKELRDVTAPAIIKNYQELIKFL